MAKKADNIIEQIRKLVGIDSGPVRKAGAKRKSASKRATKKSKRKASKKARRTRKGR